MTRYGIAEWYGHDLLDLTTTERREHADAAVNRRERPCPYRPGVCSMRQYDDHRGRITSAAGRTVIMCPSRFEQDRLLRSAPVLSHVCNPHHEACWRLAFPKPQPEAAV